MDIDKMSIVYPSTVEIKLEDFEDGYHISIFLIIIHKTINVHTLITLRLGFSGEDIFATNECVGITFDDLITLPGQ